MPKTHTVELKPSADRPHAPQKANAAAPPRELETYRAAVASGFYGRKAGGLEGKHDNVRTVWEDQVTRYALHGVVGPLVARKQVDLSRVRVLDLGAGSGEGYTILTSLRKPDSNLSSGEVVVMGEAMVGAYRGLDISPAMVEQGRAIFGDNPKVSFEVADLTHGLGPARSAAPFDIYFSSFGSLSHLRDEELARLVEDVCDHMGGTAVFVADMIGRFSYEWQCYWDEPGVDEANMRQYSMSYLYPPELLSKIEVERFPIRYWGAEELERFLGETLARKGVRVTRRHVQDRSVLVGRHMNTGEFNPRAQPIRAAVNRLHEFNVRTDLRELLFDYSPRAGFEALNGFFERFQIAWNAVVESAIDALERWDDAGALAVPPPEGLPAPVRDAICTVRDVVRNVKWFRMGDPRANVIEPQLGYILRNLEAEMQEGRGAGHGLLCIYELTREAGR